MSELSKLVNTVEFDDTQIKMNKQYQKLDILCDKIDEMIELIEDLDDSLDLTCMNAEIKMIASKGKLIDMRAALLALNTLQKQTYHQHLLTSCKAREIYNFQRLGNAIGLYKAIKEDPNP